MQGSGIDQGLVWQELQKTKNKKGGYDQDSPISCSIRLQINKANVG